MPTTAIEVSEREDPAPSPAVARDDTVFSVLAAQARGRSTPELRTTAVGCAVNAGLLLWQFPHLSWLASAFLAASAYGAWGLVDRARLAELHKESPDPASVKFLAGIGEAITGIGSLAALWTAFAFMASALGGWIH